MLGVSTRSGIDDDDRTRRVREVARHVTRRGRQVVHAGPAARRPLDLPARTRRASQHDALPVEEDVDPAGLVEQVPDTESLARLEHSRRDASAASPAAASCRSGCCSASGSCGAAGGPAVDRRRPGRRRRPRRARPTSPRTRRAVGRPARRACARCGAPRPRSRASDGPPCAAERRSRRGLCRTRTSARRPSSRRPS